MTRGQRHIATIGRLLVALSFAAAASTCSRESGLERVEKIDGDKRVVGTLKDGEKHGRWTTWLDGELYEIQHWRDGKAHGPWRRWLDSAGPMTSDGTHFNDMPHGRYRIFYAPGRLAELGWFSHGRY